MTQEKNGPDATPRIGLDLGRQIFDDQSSNGSQDRQTGANDESIRQRAYDIWEREGRTGDPHDHWYRAERELNEAAQNRPEATVQDASPAAAVEAMRAVGDQPSDENSAPKKARRKKIA